MVSEYHIPLSKPRRTAGSYALVHSVFRMSGGCGFNERLHDSVYAARTQDMAVELPLYHGDLGVCPRLGS